MTGFQTQINEYPAPAVEGDWASSNPRYSLLAFGTKLTAGPGGVTVGRFAWANAAGVVTVGGYGRLGFVHKAGQLSVIPFTLANGAPAQSTFVVPQAYEINMITAGDVWIKFASGATPGQKVYANYADGTASAAATGSPTGATSTASTIGAETSAFTASIAMGILDVTAISSGTLYPGTIVAGATGTISGNYIVEQLTGTTGSTGQYLLAYDDGTVVASTNTFTGSYGLLTIGGTVAGTYALGATVTGTGGGGVSAGTIIFANETNGASLTGTGGAGTYVVNLTQTVTSTAIDSSSNVETNWYVEDYAGNGELAPCSTRL